MQASEKALKVSDEAPDVFEEPSETYGGQVSDASEDALRAFEEALGTSAEASEESEDAPEASEKASGASGWRFGSDRKERSGAPEGASEASAESEASGRVFSSV